jgi:hypothetical protein
MTVRDDNLKCLRDTLSTMKETLATIHFEINKLIQQCETITAGLIVEEELSRGGVVDPLKAPEVVGADKNGEGGTNV